MAGQVMMPIKMDFESDVRSYIEKQFQMNNVPSKFPVNVRYYDRRHEDFGIDTCTERHDYCKLDTMTIDCDDTKDMDDAISLSETSEGWLLGVHIADVASYVHPGGVIDQESMLRGCSIYLPTSVVPMLPGYLSEDLCSLNEGVIRRTLSVMIQLNKKAEVVSYKIVKAQIKSRIQGRYGEVNDILAGTASPEVLNRYSKFTDTLFSMEELATMLRNARIKKGVSVEENNVPLFEISKTGIEMIADAHGEAGMIVEEFMVLTNSLVAQYCAEHRLPTIYRIMREGDLQASYSAHLDGHIGVALDEYLHFTSPIRRLADLRVHQMLSAHLEGLPNNAIHYFFDPLMEEGAEIATKRLRRAKNLQSSCNRYCASLYFSQHPNREFTGVLQGYNGLQQPVIKLDGYKICVTVIIPFQIRNNERYILCVCTSSTSNELFAHKLRKMVA